MKRIISVMLLSVFCFVYGCTSSAGTLGSQIDASINQTSKESDDNENISNVSSHAYNSKLTESELQDELNKIEENIESLSTHKIDKVVLSCGEQTFETSDINIINDWITTFQSMEISVGDYNPTYGCVWYQLMFYSENNVVFYGRGFTDGNIYSENIVDNHMYRIDNYSDICDIIIDLEKSMGFDRNK